MEDKPKLIVPNNFRLEIHTVKGLKGMRSLTCESIHYSELSKNARGIQTEVSYDPYDHVLMNLCKDVLDAAEKIHELNENYQFLIPKDKFHRPKTNISSLKKLIYFDELRDVFIKSEKDELEPGKLYNIIPYDEFINNIVREHSFKYTYIKLKELDIKLKLINRDLDIFEDIDKLL